MKRNLSFKWFAFMLLAFLSANSYAQTVTCQPNMDFGLGNFTNWNYYEGTFIGSGSNPGVLVDTMHVFPPSTQTNKRFTIESGTSTDLYGGFPIADPTRTYSLKIGFDTINYCVNKARFQVHVPAGTNDYALIYRYAIVMEDPGHIASQQPRFLVKTTDSTTGSPLACGNFTYVAGSLPGFNLSSTTVGGTPVYYKSWATASLNLSGYAGKTITVDFEAVDCALGGHFGYGYFDMTCGLFEIAINNCNLGGNTTVSAPPGFQTYQWYDSSYTTVFSTADTTTFATPTSSKTYHVICTPYSGYGCPDTLTTRINISNLTIHASNDTTICSGASVTLNAGASGGAIPLSYSWNPSTSLSCNTCATTIASPTTSESYVITVSDSFNCHRSDTINVTVNHIASVTTDPTTATSCQNTSVSFTAAATGTPTPTVQWQQSTNGGSTWSNISGATSNTYSFTCSASQNAYKYRAVYSNTCGNDTSAAATLNVNTIPVVTTDPTASTTACNGATASFTAASSGTPTPTVQWQQSTNGGSTWSNISGATSSTYSFTVSSTQNSYKYRAIFTNTCGSDTSNASTLTVNPLLTPSVSISGTSTICAGTPVTFTATPVNGGTSPAYQWKKNGSSVGTNGNTYTDSALANGDQITCVLTSNATCASPTTATSTAITMTVNPLLTPSVSVSANQPSTICAGTVVTFTATPTNGGSSPSYQWYKNNLPAGTNSATYTDSALTNSDFVSCLMTSNATCRTGNTASSNSITFTVNPVVTPSISINGTNNICAGTSVTFTASISNGGSSPVYQWKKNGSNVGTNSYTYTNASLSNGDIITCVLTSNVACATSGTATSNAITMTVNPVLTPSVSIGAVPGTSVYNNTSVTFTATPTNGGSSPSYQWKKNGVNVGTNSATYTDNSFTNGDVISCVVTSNAICVSPATATGSVTMTVSNRPPVANDDVNSTNGNTAVSGNVSTNDTDPDGNLNPNSYTLTCTTCTNVAHGTLVFNNNGTYTYTPNNGFTGTDHFIYQVCDTGSPSLCDTALVTITVNNRPPVALPDVNTTNGNTAVSGNVATNDSDPDGNLNTSSYTLTCGTCTNVANGTLVFNNNGTYTYTPNPGFTGTDHFIYQVCDNGTPSLCDTAIVTITVNNRPPVANDDVNSTNGNTAVSGNVSTNDSDPDGNLNTSSYTLTCGTCTNVANGTLIFNNNGTYTYTPNSGFTGTDHFIYQVCDNGTPSLCDTAIVTITVNNRPPVANDDVNTTNGNTAVSGNVSTNDSDPDGNLNTSSYTLTCATCTNVANGTLVFNNNGTYTYTPNNGFTGTDHFIYQVCDNGTPSLCDTAIVTITVNNRPPVANDDVNTTNGNTAASGNVSTNDTDPDGNLNTNSYTLTCATCTNVANGTLVFNNNGTYTYTPNSGFTGTDHFIYQVCDNGTPSLCDTAIVTITVNNRPPVANPDTYTTNGNTAVSGNVGTNDTDPDGNLNTSSYTLTCATCSNVSNGTLVFNSNGTFTYTPNNGFTGTDHFIYQVCDNGTPSLCDTAIVTINATNRPPVALPDVNTTNGNTAVSGNVSTNDSDPDGNLNTSSYTLTCATCTNVANGTLVFNNNGTYTYTPNPGFTGTDHFIYQVCDNGTPSLCDTAIVTITVNNRPPAANDDANTTNGNTVVSGNVSTNDSDPDGNLNPNSYTTTCGTCSTPANGTLVFNNNGTYTYTPNSGFTGTDHFIYQVCDNGTPSLCDTAMVTITVNNRPPAANDDVNTTNGNTAVSGNVSTNDTDPDGNLNSSSYTLTCATCTNVANGTLVFNNNGTYTYTPNNGFTGTDHFIYQVCDNGTPSLCDTAIVTITVNNRPPVANDDTTSTHGNTTVSGNVGTNDTDPDGNLNTNSFTLTCGTCTNVTHGTLVFNNNGTYTYTPNNGFYGTDQFIYQVCDNGTPSLCDTAIVTITVDPVPSVVITASPCVTICAGAPIVFTAVPTNGGSTPSYQWKKNNVNVGNNSNTYTDYGLNNNDMITCVLTSNMLNAFPTSVTSNALTITVNPLPAQPGTFTTSSAITYQGQVGVTYTVPSVPGVTYVWNYSGTGATINGSGNSVTVDFATNATSGNLCVTATTVLGCGPSASRCIAITVKPYETWTCSTNNDWNNPANWDGGFVPYGTISVLIPAGTPCNPHVCSATANVYNMTVNSGATVNICCPYNVNVNDNLTLNGSVLGCGYLTITGSSCHIIYGNGIIDNFELNNSCGGIISIGDTLHIVETYKPTLGVMTVNGGLELLSDSTTTAVILTHPGTCSNYINGEVICDKYIHGGRRAFRFLGHPFTSSIGLNQLTPYMDITGQGGSANGFTTTATNNPSAFWYNTSTGNGSSTNDTGWTAFTNTNGAGANAWNRFEGIRLLFRGTPGQGLGCNVCVPNPVTIKMHGPINECDEVVSCTPNSNIGYNFISNPYPSNIDLSLTTRGSSIGANFSVWDPNQGTEGAYVDQPFSFSYILPAYSAFFTTVTAATNNTITFHESDKTAAAASGNLFKTTSGFGNNVVQLRILSNNDSLSWDRLLLFFNGQAMANLDGLDNLKLYNPGLSFYSNSADASQLSIDVRPYVNGQVIPLGLQNADPMAYSIRVDDYNVPAGATLYLHDKYLNQIQPLSQGMHYNFTVTSDPASQGDNRFELNLNGNPSGINNVTGTKDFKVFMMPNPATDYATITFEADQPGNTVVRVSSITGQVVYNNTIGEKQSGKVIVPLQNIAPGVYIVTIVCGNHSVTERLLKQ